MRRSEYDTQAYINDGLNQQRGLDSLEGSAALSQATKPEVDGTDVQKTQILLNAHDKHPAVQSLSPGNPRKGLSGHRKPAETVEKIKISTLLSNDNVRRTK